MNPIVKYFGYGKSILRVSPIFLNRLIFDGHIAEKRPAVYNTGASENVYAFFGEADHIIDHLYLGSGYHASNWEWLTHHNIGYVVNAATEVNCFFPDDLEYLPVTPIRDNGEDLFENLENIIDRIYQIKLEETVEKEDLEETVEKEDLDTKDTEDVEKECLYKKNILIHCLVGRSRSVTIIIAYLMKYHHMTADDALKYIVNKRKYANPSVKLMDSLRNFQWR